MIGASVLAASRHPKGGPTLYTLTLQFPTFLLPEVLTHRDRARNTSSTRAVPTRKLVGEPPYVPAVFRANQKGMQPGEALPHDVQCRAREAWHQAIEACRKAAETLTELGVHKQWAGRPLLWFGWTRMVMTSVHWEHFLSLRDHPDAQDEFQELARSIRQAIERAKPATLAEGAWHLPFVDDAARVEAKNWSEPVPVPAPVDQETAVLLAVSVARCARVSYFSNTFPGFSTIAEDVALFHRLRKSGHWSPFEHQALPDEPADEESPFYWRQDQLHGPLTGWRQLRKYFREEYRRG